MKASNPLTLRICGSTETTEMSEFALEGIKHVFGKLTSPFPAGEKETSQEEWVDFFKTINSASEEAGTRNETMRLLMAQELASDPIGSLLGMRISAFSNLDNLLLKIDDKDVLLNRLLRELF